MSTGFNSSSVDTNRKQGGYKIYDAASKLGVVIQNLEETLVKDVLACLVDLAGSEDGGQVWRTRGREGPPFIVLL
jgi:hypothetical protein